LGEPRRGSNNLFGKIYSLYKNLTTFTWGI
jgi:hypothetical protein